MSEQTKKVEEREHHAVRASHAKSSACVVGELTVTDGLPPELAQGLFAAPGRFDVAVRLAQGPGETLGDRVSTHRGMAVKVFGVQGEKLPGHNADTQDFVFATGTTFPSGTAKGFLKDGTAIGKAVGTPEGFKSAVSATARGFNQALHAFGGESAKADFFGHPFSHPLSEGYFSQAPVRFGDHVAKLAIIPVAPQQLALADWPVSLSPYRTVATLRRPRQDAYGAERVRFFDEVMSFQPAHTLAAHQPLGSVMRARLQVYRALVDLRHRDNGVAGQEPVGVQAIPA